MKQSILIFAIIALITSCKTQHVVPYVLKDSVSVTYKQGETPLTPLIGEESEKISRTAKAVIQRSDPTGQSPVVQRSGPAPVVRVDTVFIERWHTTKVPSPPEPIPRFYKDCTWGFFILVLLMLGRIALRIAKAVRLYG